MKRLATNGRVADPTASSAPMATGVYPKDGFATVKPNVETDPTR